METMTTTVTTPVNTTSLARAAYRAARRCGAGEETALEAAWKVVRRAMPHLRAPSGIEAVGTLNTSRRRNYRCPLGQALSVPGCTGCYGQYCSMWPRTVASWREREETVKALIAFMEGA
jgi:hypothetical protein